MAIVGASWTYGDPSSSDLYLVRAMIGDTDQDDQLISDEEITAFLTLTSSVWDAASMCATRIAADFDRSATELEVGDLRVAYADRSTGFRQLAAWFRDNKLANVFAGIAAGGLSKSARATILANTDLYHPTIYRGIMTNEGS